ncbi:KpsF/GutQ family sugar-phosphate isomerase [Desulfovibrio sp. OttesenSCG-928-I05]|nr:KpsF/GutQ family sugar-phosphate isomerase [Desulfovibrio sp. OttesenSCG-928-I05]
MTQNRNEWVQTAREVFDTEIQGLEAVRDQLDASFEKAVTLLGACTGRVVVTGLGKSGLVGRKIAATLSSTGTPSFFLHPVEGAHGDMGSIRRDDIILALSNSGRTEELNAIMPTVRALCGGIIAMTGGEDSPLARMADIVLNTRVPREACSLNLAPTASTTAALAMGDALAVCLMRYKSFTPDDFRLFHPGGSLGQRLSLKVSEIMHRENLPLADLSASLGDALRVLDEGGIGAVLFTDGDGALAGILTDGDVRRMVNRGTFDRDIPSRDVMVAGPLHGTEDQSAAELLDIMESRTITVLPVTDGRNRLLGVVHLHDLLGKGSVRFAEKDR